MEKVQAHVLHDSEIDQYLSGDGYPTEADSLTTTCLDKNLVESRVDSISSMLQER